MSALVVGGTDTNRRTGPQLVLFQCLTLASPGQGLWRCQAWACDRVKFLKWLIGEIGVVEEMIWRKAPSE
ncbi:hypothetical protein Taro_045781 [Colocasia esculenta]|uniref:Uncharacterized protein n=1 Tax=Colocasia esculenta TaxID=4460 RepID=A0A843X391_COLES|nr:hypothetical protein [Colocasia esculenta]